MFSFKKSKDEWLHFKLSATMVVLVLAAGALGVGAIFGLELVKSHYEEKTHALYDLRKRLHKLSYGIAEVRRDERYLNDKSQNSLDIQTENVANINKLIDDLSQFRQDILSISVLNELRDALNTYLISFDKVGQWKIEQGDSTSGLIHKSDRLIDRAEGFVINRKDRSFQNSFNRFNTMRLRYLFASEADLYEAMTGKLDTLIQDAKDKELIAILSELRGVLQRIADLRWYAGLEEASFLKNILIAERKVSNSLIFVDNRILDKKSSINKLIISVTWMLITLVIMTFTAVFFGSSFVRKYVLLFGKDRTQMKYMRNQLTLILDRIDAGILSVDSQGKLGPDYSKSVEVIVEEEELAGKSFYYQLLACSNLAESEVHAVKEQLSTIFSQKQESVLETMESFPENIEFITASGLLKHLSISWSPVFDGDKLTRLFLMIQDNTERVKIMEESQKDRDELSILVEILEQPARKIHDFFVENRQQIDGVKALLNTHRNQKTLRENLSTIVSMISKVKSHARSMKFDYLANFCFDFELQLNDLKKVRSIDNTDSIITSLDRVILVFEQYRSVYNHRIVSRFGNFRFSKDDDLVFAADGVGKMISSRSNDNELIDLYLGIKRRQGLTLPGVVYQAYDVVPKMVRDHHKVAAHLIEELPDVILTKKGSILFGNMFPKLFAISILRSFSSIREHEEKGSRSFENIFINIYVTDDWLCLTYSDEGKGFWSLNLDDHGPTLIHEHLSTDDLEAQLLGNGRPSDESEQSMISDFKSIDKLVYEIGGKMSFTVSDDDCIRYVEFIFPRDANIFDSVMPESIFTTNSLAG